MIEAALAALAGLLIGSFLNVCIYRLPRDISVVAPRSFCPECDKQIAWFDNIPLLSYMILRGRCRKCGERIPMRYPIVELLTAGFFFCAVWMLGPTVAAMKFCVFSAILITLVFSDLEERILPDEFTLGGAALGVIFAAFVPFNYGLVRLLLMRVDNPRLVSMAEALFSALFCGGTLWLVGFLYEKIRHREGLGFGDVKMVAMIGAFLGLQGALMTLIAGSLLGAIVGLCYIWFTGKDASTYELPFGTFLGAAALGVGFFGEVFLTWYNRLGTPGS
ncbi:MAG TPA: prepilin peptidase [Bryobacteraceae bacterium]|nr:prepilin peptidase [Bryobacteraceae bacterium]